VLYCSPEPNLDELVAAARQATTTRMQIRACQQIVNLDGDAAVEVLIQFLDDDRLWYCAAHGIGTRRHRIAVDELLKQARKQDSRAYKMVWALGQIADPAVLPDLKELLEEIDAQSEDAMRLRSSLEDVIRQMKAKP
jgi:HEAT repeat protein